MYVGEVHRGGIISDVKGSERVLFLKLHHRGERECKFQNKPLISEIILPLCFDLSQIDELVKYQFS